MRKCHCGGARCSACILALTVGIVQQSLAHQHDMKHEKEVHNQTPGEHATFPNKAAILVSASSRGSNPVVVRDGGTISDWASATVSVSSNT